MRQADELSQTAILKKISEALSSDNRVRALFVGGSFAADKANRYSDLDLYIVVDNEQYQQFVDDRLKMAQRVAPVLFHGDVLMDFHLFIVIFENMVKADLGIAPVSNFAHIHTGPFKVLLDRDNLLDGVDFAEKVSRQSLRNELAEIAKWFWYDIFAIAGEMRKDDFWTAHLVIERAREKLARLMSIRCAPQNEPRGYNKLGRSVPPQDLAPLAKTFYRFDEKEMWESVNTMVDIFEKEARFLCGKYGISYPQHLHTNVRTYFQTELRRDLSS